MLHGVAPAQQDRVRAVVEGAVGKDEIRHVGFDEASRLVVELRRAEVAARTWLVTRLTPPQSVPLAHEAVLRDAELAEHMAARDGLEPTAGHMVALLHLPHAANEASIRQLLVRDQCMSRRVMCAQASRGAPEPLELFMRFNQQMQFRGLALLRLESLAECARAIAALNGVVVDGHTVRLQQ